MRFTRSGGYFPLFSFDFFLLLKMMAFNCASWKKFNLFLWIYLSMMVMVDCFFFLDILSLFIKFHFFVFGIYLLTIDNWFFIFRHFKMRVFVFFSSHDYIFINDCKKKGFSLFYQGDCPSKIDRSSSIIFLLLLLFDIVTNEFSITIILTWKY